MGGPCLEWLYGSNRFDLSLNKTREDSMGDAPGRKPLTEDEGLRVSMGEVSSLEGASGEAFDFGQLRSKSSASRSRTMAPGDGCLSPPSTDSTLYWRPSSNSTTPPKKSSSSSSI